MCLNLRTTTRTKNQSHVLKLVLNSKQCASFPRQKHITSQTPCPKSPVYIFSQQYCQHESTTIPSIFSPLYFCSHPAFS